MPTKEQYKKMSTEEIQKEFDKANHMTKVSMAFALALKNIFSSELHEDIKADALHSAIMFFKASIEVNTMNNIAKCNIETKVPMEYIIGFMGQKFIEKEDQLLKKFRTMMELFDS